MVSHIVSQRPPFRMPGWRPANCFFGDADDNVGYVFFVKEDLEKAGHYVELSFTTQKVTIQNLDRIVIADKMPYRKNA